MNEQDSRDSGHSHWPQNPDSEETKSKEPILRNLPKVSKELKRFQNQHKMRKQKEGGYEDAIISCFSEEFWKHSALRGHTALPTVQAEMHLKLSKEFTVLPKTGSRSLLFPCFPDTYPLSGCYTALKVMPWEACAGNVHTFRVCGGIKGQK